MELSEGLFAGLSVALHPHNLLFCFVGVLLGTLIGVLPGIGPLATIAMLLPITFGFEPVSALIMLSGIYYGAQYGGSTTAILVNMPGEASSVVTTLDGYQMARQGRAGAALATAAIGSFVAGCVATLVIALFAPALARAALSFGPAEYTALMLLGLVAAVVLAGGSLLKSLLMVLAGVFLGLVGIDVNSGTPRYTFGIPELYDGIGFLPVAMGLFGIAEILRNLEQPEARSLLTQKITGLMPTRADLRKATPAMGRGTLVGSLLGVLPGGGAMLASFAAYMVEKRVSKTPERFGNGAIEGVAGPEAANNAAAQTSFIPMLTLGIPPNAVMALMVGAMTIHGLQPGPRILIDQPQVFWGLIASMWVGNLMLLVVNLPLVGVWVRLLRVPYRVMIPIILTLCCIGVYSINSSTFEVGLAALFGLIGYGLYKLGFEPAPLILGLVLGQPLEENIRRMLLMSGGDPAILIERPIAATLLVATVLLLALALAPQLRAKRQDIFQEEK